MKHTYDKKTANFRTIRNLKGYNDDETGFPPSEVDQDGYEDINSLVARMLRGEIVRASRSVQFDGDAPAEDLIAGQSPMDRDGSDLADIGPLMDEVTDTIKNERKKAKKASKVDPLTPPAGAVETPPKEPQKPVTDGK